MLLARMNQIGLSAMRARLRPALAGLLAAAIAVTARSAEAHFELQDFEDHPHDATEITTSGVAFELTGQLAVQDGEALFGPGASYGASGSARWFGTSLGHSTGTVGALRTAYATNGFEVQQVSAWTSADGGNTRARIRRQPLRTRCRRL